MFRGLIPFALTLLLIACGGDTKTATQAVAEVNGDEITIHQVNFELSRLGSTGTQQAKAASRQILDNLVDQQLLIQKAMEEKIDREPKVVQAIENARRQILAQSYLEKRAQGITKPTESEIKEFYAGHPELFAQRRIYHLREVIVPDIAGKDTAIRDRMTKSKSMDDLLKWMNEEKIPFSVTTVAKAAEQMSLEMAAKFHALKDGQVGAFADKTSLLLAHVLASQVRPLSEEQARPFIENFLVGKKRADLARGEVKKLRDTAKIEYMGSFAQTAKTNEPAVDKPTAPAKTESDAKQSPDFMEKGLSGLN